MAALIGTAWAQDAAPRPDRDEVRVGDAVIRTQDVLRRMVEDFGSGVLDELVFAKLVEQRASAAGISVPADALLSRLQEAMAGMAPDAYVETLTANGLTVDVVLRRIRTGLLVDVLLDREIQVTDEEIAEAYEAQKESLRTPERRLFSHLVFEQEEKAQVKADELRKGLLVQPETMVLKDRPTGNLREADPILRVVFGELTAPPQVSAPFRTADRWHVVRLENILPAQEPNLAECRGLIRERVLSAKRERLRPEWTRKLRESAQVSVQVDPM